MRVVTPTFGNTSKSEPKSYAIWQGATEGYPNHYTTVTGSYRDAINEVERLTAIFPQHQFYIGG